MASRREELHERLRAEANAAHEQRSPSPARDRPPRSNPNGYLAAAHMMTGIRMRGFLGIWAGTITGAVVLLAILLDRSMPTLGWIVAGIMVSAVPTVLLVVLVRFVPYHRWREKLPFPVEGSFDVLAADRSGSYQWRTTQVRVDIARRDDAETVALSLRVLSDRANQHIYDNRFRRITRWAADGLTAAGHANVRVAWTLYRFVATELAALATAGVTIQRVSIEAEPLGMYIPPEEDPSNTSFYD